MSYDDRDDHRDDRFDADRFDEPRFDPAYDPNPPRAASPLKWILLTLLGVGAVVLLACCVTGFFAYRGGMSLAGSAVAEQFQDDPAVRQHIGEIESASMNLSETRRRNEENVANKAGMVIDVVGSNGRGQIHIKSTKTDPDTGKMQATLELPSGEQIAIYGLPREGLEIDIDTGEFEVEEATEPGDAALPEGDASAEAANDVPLEGIDPQLGESEEITVEP